MPDSPTADELLTSIRVLNQVFEIAPKERIKNLLLRIEELHRPIADGIEVVGSSAETVR